MHQKVSCLTRVYFKMRLAELLWILHTSDMGILRMIPCQTCTLGYISRDGPVERRTQIFDVRYLLI